MEPRLASPPAGRSGPDRGAPVRPGRGGVRRLGVEAAAVAVAVLALALLGWLAIGAVFAALRLVELILVAALAGWAGYRLGRFRGRRER